MARLKESGMYQENLTVSQKKHRDYLQTEHWRNFVQKYHKRYPQASCLVCGSKDYQLHHLSYRNLYREKFANVVPLCSHHHEAVHQILFKRGWNLRKTSWAIAILRGEDAKPRTDTEKKQADLLERYSKRYYKLKNGLVAGWDAKRVDDEQVELFHEKYNFTGAKYSLRTRKLDGQFCDPEFVGQVLMAQPHKRQFILDKLPQRTRTNTEPKPKIPFSERQRGNPYCTNSCAVCGKLLDGERYYWFEFCEYHSKQVQKILKIKHWGVSKISQCIELIKSGQWDAWKTEKSRRKRLKRQLKNKEKTQKHSKNHLTQKSRQFKVQFTDILLIIPSNVYCRKVKENGQLCRFSLLTNTGEVFMLIEAETAIVTLPWRELYSIVLPRDYPEKFVCEIYEEFISRTRP